MGENFDRLLFQLVLQKVSNIWWATKSDPKNILNFDPKTDETF